MKGKLSDGNPLPDYLFAVCPWILAGSEDEAWYGLTIKQQTIDAVKSIPPFVRGEAWFPPTEELKAAGLDLIADMPVPQNGAFPTYARQEGYPIQISGPKQLCLDETWAFQIYCNEAQTEYVVVYAIEDDWDRIGHTLIRKVKE